ncbi:uncharacterized protein Z519_10362 [Cladophialophora bantiana CBS 173.52]|uniref:DUF7702 domain-containing protein n=1 Tax=Cladophialophora bantiana (strain ATCC 10958 / CBS 173.52 / CDC B-1940 / NIH 8579) TaxID=1442370 RepID=A0A0D2H6D1_CLAB1|nr:uncharacterized protein Z519_10362 [Cladophialophora bantiana CBS 173.52]KIW88878.1 hypothetical protein Z519_10362 [Cladophialophora bantiana CBS 173.52]
MALDSTTKLSIAELAIYVVLLPLTAWLHYKHGRRALSTFFFLFAFDILRIVAAGIQISDHNNSHPSTSGAIVSSVGLSPLLLACAGLLTLLRGYYATSNRSQFATLIEEAGIHVGAITGIALLATGGAKLGDDNNTQSDINTAYTLLETGAVILLATWIAVSFLCSHICLKLLQNRRTAGPLMLLACIFTGVRAIYSVVYAFDHAKSLSPFTGTFAVKFVFMFLVQLIAFLLLLAVAFVTRNILSDHGMSAWAQERRTGNRGGGNRHPSIPLISRSSK